MKTTILKLWSENPARYKPLTPEEAGQKYGEYVTACLKSLHNTEIKSFGEWLKTEM